MVAFEERRTETGVSFSLTEEQKELRRLARDFAAKEIRRSSTNATRPCAIRPK